MKKIKILMIFFVCGISVITHFFYEWFPSLLTSIFFPVNESIWEHMKIIYTSLLLTSIVGYFLYKKSNRKVSNFMISIPITSIIGIIFYLIIYLILDSFIPHNPFISITLLFLTFILCEILSYFLLNSKEIKHQSFIGLILIILSYLIFFYFTYYPIHNYLFLDSQTNTYGINP